MTILYPNGTVVEAILLSYQDDALRAAAPDSDDVLTFTRVHGVWISEEIEPVTIQFEWQRHGMSQVVAEADCVCSKALASRLISHLLGNSERDELAANPLYILTAEGLRVGIGHDQLRPS